MLSSLILDGIKLLLVPFTELFPFVLFVLLFVVAVVVLDGFKNFSESFTSLLFVFSFFVLLLVTDVVVLDDIKMVLVSFTVFLFLFALLFVFALFVLLIVTIIVVALTAACGCKSSSS